LSIIVAAVEDAPMADTDDRLGIPVGALASDTVVRVAPDATLYEIADALAGGEVGMLVVGDPGAVVGVVSERDVVRALANRADPSLVRANEVAQRELIWCDANASVAEVATEMMEHYVRHILVEENGTLVGIVSARDLLGAYAAADSVDLDD
jgi:CBS domain-containing protein